VFSIGSQLPIDIGPQLSKGRRGDTAKRKQFLFGVYVDFDIVVRGIVDKIFIPA